MERVILHSDMNGFYAGVECVYHPELKDKPVAVCGSTEMRHGIVLAKNGAAKKYGVKTGQAVWQARRLCPALIALEPHFDRYLQFSAEAKKIYGRYSDRVESFGLDECWIDATGYRAPGSNEVYTGERIADEIRRAIQDELGVTVSVGVSWNKIFAKLGSDMKKPNAVTAIHRYDFKQKVWPLPASNLLFVGRATARRLEHSGIRTIGDLAAARPEFLQHLLGKWGETLWAFANGYDLSPVAKSDAPGQVKSVGNSMTTHRDIENEGDAWKVITCLSESVAERLRKGGFRCETVQLSMRDSRLRWTERQAKMGFPCCTAQEISVKCRELLLANYDFRLPLRSLGVRVCDLCGAGDGIQLAFFGESARRERTERIEQSMDAIRRRFGPSAIQRAVLLDDDITRDPTPQLHRIHPGGAFSK